MSNLTKRLVGTAAAVALSAGLAVTAAPAEANAATVWDRVAKCESGGNWKINTGNGYYGGLQFSASTWRAYGGGKYASHAHKATKAQQIAIAKKVLKGQGPGAWPVCSKRAGLTRSNGLGVKVSTSTKAAKKSTKKSTRKATPKRAVSGKTIKVRSGDTLGTIAKRYNVKGGWKGLWKLNKSTVKNPNRIHIGQTLRIR